MVLAWVEVTVNDDESFNFCLGGLGFVDSPHFTVTPTPMEDGLAFISEQILAKNEVTVRAQEILPAVAEKMRKSAR